MRSLLFVSHANPEDNTPSLWLTLRLAAEGYRVWSDLTDLIGGEDFWRDIEKILRDEAVKFLYVLTKTSNAKDGPLAELHLAKKIARAENLSDFVIPVVFDNIRSADFNIEVTRLNAISFCPTWADGLTQLMRKLDKEQVPRDLPAGRAASREWWNKQSPPLRREPESYISNWFSIVELPKVMYIHQLKRKGTGLLDVRNGLPYPAYQQAAWLVSFAPQSDLDQALGPDISIASSQVIDTDQLDVVQSPIDRKRVRDLFSSLLRESWEWHAAQKLPDYEMSGGFRCFYFPFREDASYARVRSGQKGSRQLVGIKTIKTAFGSKQTRYWHFGIDVRTRIYPVPSFIVFPHVIFTDDGSTPWASKSRMHKARRSQCKDWWNPHWRDRLLGAVSWMADGKDTIAIAVSSKESLVISTDPIAFTSPVSYDDPGAGDSSPTLPPEDLYEDDELDDEH